jgi:hypothetical protein
LLAFRLALQCGYPHPRMMLERMTSNEFYEAMVYAIVEPYGENREELRHGQLMHLLDRANFKRDTPLKPIDFMNFVNRPEEKEPELTPEEMAKRIDREVFGL